MYSSFINLPFALTAHAKIVVLIVNFNSILDGSVTAEKLGVEFAEVDKFSISSSHCPHRSVITTRLDNDTFVTNTFITFF